MKKILMAVTMLTSLSVANSVKAQDVIIEKDQVQRGKKGSDNKKTEEITIRKNGDKDVNLKVEINGDKITVNGKPLSEFKDKDITINKRKITISDGNGNYNLMLDGNGDGAFNLGDHFGDMNWGDNEESDNAFLGVTTNDAEGGVKITEVVKGSAAGKAGLKSGDIITKIGDEKIGSPAELSEVVSAKKPKDEVKITYKRDGKESAVKATLGKRMNKIVKTFRFNGPGPGAQSFGPAERPPFTNMEGFNEDIQELTQDALTSTFPFRKKIGLKIQDTEDGGNVKVINVEDSSAAATAGMKKDDLITEINGKKIDNTDDAREELMPDEDKKSYKIKALRNGVEMSFDVKIPRKLKTANL